MLDIPAAKARIARFVTTALRDAPLREDLGDYLPFLAAIGERSFCEQQIALAASAFRNGFATGASFPALRRFRSHLLVPELNTDTLVGFLELDLVSHDPSLLRHAEALVATLSSDFVQNGNICGFRIPALRYSAPIARGMNGLYAELLCDFAAQANEPRYLSQARSFADAWLRNPFFQRHGLFPESSFFRQQWRNRFLAEAATVRQFKPNTSVANGILAVAEATGEPAYREALFRWFAAVQRTLTDSAGAVHGRWDSRTGRRSEPLLLHAFPTIDLLCDAAHGLKAKELLPQAEALAEFWLSRRTAIGLIPQHKDGGPTLLDSLTDFSCALFRLHELTGKQRYRAAAIELVEANLSCHAVTPDLAWDFEGGKPTPLPAYVEQVDAATGAPANRTIKPKFIALLLKPLIYLESGKRMYEDRTLRKLMRDR